MTTPDRTTLNRHRLDQHNPARLYADRLRDVDNLLGLIRAELDALADYNRADGIDWSHAGSMGHIRERLVELLTTLIGDGNETDARERIEDTLAELA